MRLVQPVWLITSITISMTWSMTMSFAAEVNWPVPIATPSPLATAAANLNTAMTTYIADPTPANAQALAQAQATYNQAIVAARTDNPTATLTVSGGNQDTINGNNSSANSFTLNDQAAFIHATGDNTSLTILNHVGNSGSAILLSSGAILDINAETGAQVIFTNNTGGEGGVIYSDNSTLSLSNTTFVNNTAEFSGGAIYSNNSTLILNSSIFINNAAAAGGALFSANSTISINDSTFANNTAEFNGGVIFSGDSALGLFNSTFSNNTASEGGVLYSANNTTTVNNSTFANNTANTGGAIYNLFGVLNLNNSTLSNNIANERGGAIFNDGGELNLINSTLNNNITNGAGGAIYNGFGSTLSLTNSTFAGNIANERGGAIFNDSAAISLLVTANNNALFTGNIVNERASSINFTVGDGILSSLDIFIEAGGVLDMRDPMDSTDNAGEIAISQTGQGTWRLGGANTFTSADNTGSTNFTVNEGQLYLYADGEVANGNAIDPSALVTAGRISLLGSESSFTLGTGATLVASGDNAISTEGSIVLQEGSLIRGGNSTDRGEPVGGITSVLRLSAANDITLAGKVALAALSADDQFTLRGNLTGSGGLNKTGAGLVILDGLNRYKGGTTVTAGILRAGSATAFAVNTAYQVNGGTLDLNGFDLTMSLLSGTGGEVALGTAALTVNQRSNTTFAGELVGQGNVTKQGQGRLILTGQSANYTGTTRVNSGELRVNGLLGGDLRVSAAGRLSGSGTVGNTTVAGTIAPGNSIGTLTVAGNYVQTAGSVYDVEINPAGASDLINISGRATLQPGAGVSVLKTAGLYTPGTRYTILAAENGVVGTYSNLSQNLPFLELLLNYDTNHVYLDIARNDRPFNSFAVTPNQAETAMGVESLGGGNRLYDAFVNLDNPQTIQTALNDLSGEIYASTLSALMEESRYVRDAMRSRLDSNDTLAEAKTPSGLAFWAHGFGAAGQLEGNGNAAKLDRSTQGFFIGADQAFGGTGRFGVVGGYSQSTFDVDSRHSYSESDNAHLGAYGRLAFNHLVASAGAAYSWHTLSTHRTIAFPGFTNLLNSTGDAHTAQVVGELGYELAVNYLDMKPLVNVAYVDVKADNLTEQGGDARLRAHKASQSVLLSTLGVQEKGLLYQTDMYALNHHVFLGWRHAYDNLTPKATFNFAAGSVPFFIG
ncbi:autotransporter domain-containing protein, partial [Legionella beliardensis]